MRWHCRGRAGTSKESGRTALCAERFRVSGTICDGRMVPQQDGQFFLNVANPIACASLPRRDELPPQSHTLRQRRMLRVAASARHFCQSAAWQKFGQTLRPIRCIHGAQCPHHNERWRGDVRQDRCEIDCGKIRQGFQDHILRCVTHLLDIPFAMQEGSLVPLRGAWYGAPLAKNADNGQRLYAVR